MFISEKYLRHQQIHWLSQEELFKSKVLIVGVGAIGNELLKNLALLGVGYICIVDFDVIQIHNLTRSVLFTNEDINQKKVEVAKEKIKKINPDICVESYFGDIYDLPYSFFKNFDCIFSTVDNYETRIRLHQLSFFNQIDFFNSGIDSQFVSIDFYPYSKNRLLCFECNLDPKIYHNIQKRYSCGWIQKYAYEQKKIPTTILTASLSASILTSVFVHKKRYEEPFRIFIDTISWNFTNLQFLKNSNCYFCSQWQNYKEISKDELYNKIKELREDTTIFCNEPILISTQCLRCGFFYEYWQLSRNFTEKDLNCKECHFDKIKILVKDSFSLGETLRLKSLQWKFLYYFDQKENSMVLVPND